MDRSIRRLFVFFVLIFVGLVVQLTYVQVWAAPRLNTDAYNTRGVERQMRVERGLILAADGTQLAVNRKDGAYFLREYPEGSLTSPWLGYSSLRYGRAGVERAYNPELSGDSDLLSVRNLLDLVTGTPTRGADLRLTLDPKVQRAAVEALGDNVGAVVALDPRTGAVLAWANSPRFDPNSIDEEWKQLNEDPGKPLVDRALQGRYPPGSVFKVIVAAAALETGRGDTGDGVRRSSGRLVGRTATASTTSTARAIGEHTFAEAFANSVNTTFAKVGVQMGAEELNTYAHAFGFDQQAALAVGWIGRQFPRSGRDGQGQRGPGLLRPGRGAGHAHADGAGGGGRGQRRADHAALRGERGAGLQPGRFWRRPDPGVWLRPISSATAATLRDLMVKVVRGRHGNPGRDRGRQGGGQDRHRGDRRRGGSFLVHRVRPGAMPREWPWPWWWRRARPLPRRSPETSWPPPLAV